MPEEVEEPLGMGYQSTPVTLIDGEAVAGFDREKIGKMLGG